MESQGLYCFMLFYLKEGIQVLPNTDDHVPRTIKQGWFDDYEDDDRMTCYINNEQKLYDDDQQDLLL